MHRSIIKSCSWLAVSTVVLGSSGCFKSQEEQLREKAEHGDPVAMCELANALESPTGGGGLVRQPNTSQAIDLYRKAARSGYAPAMYELSQVLTKSINDEERVMWLTKGAKLENGACVTELIKGYTHGMYGLAIDRVEAFRWVKIGWQMDFKQRGYDQRKQTEEMQRLVANYRSHLKISLSQNGETPNSIDAILAQIH